jgi:outer membrane protein OmpA-like peptidoglycan-associated protein
MIIARRLIFLIFLLGLITACTPYKKSIYIPKGVFEEEILIRSEPTEAMIYVNGEEIGETPFRTSLFYSEDKLINIKAVPIYPNQFTQNIFVRVPPIPKTMTIYMNEKPNFVFETEEEKPQPPAKRPPVEIVKYDTLYVDRISYYTTPTIYFEFDKTDINVQDGAKLRSLVQFLKKNPEVYVDILGAADIRGGDKYNIELSLNRSKAVAEYLNKYGIPMSRLYTRGVGRTTIYDEVGRPMSHQESRTVIFNLYVNRADFEKMKAEYEENYK